VAHRENRWFGRCYFTISDLQKNIPRTKSRHMSWPTFVNILKHPPLRAIEVATHERRTDCVTPRNFRTFRVSKSRVTSFIQFFPIRPVHAGIKVLPSHKPTDPGINLVFRFRVETHWPPKGIGDPP